MRSIWIALALLLAACAQSVDPAREAQATEAYADLVGGRDDELTASMAPEARAAVNEALLEQMRGYAPDGPIPEPRSLNWTWHSSGSFHAYELRQEYAYPDQAVHWSVAMAREGDGPWMVTGIHINTFDSAVAEAARFSLVGRPIQNYLVLTGAVLSFLLCLATAGLAAWRRRWLWMFGCLFGFGQITLNWATGEIYFEAARFALFGAGFLKGGGVADPWFVSFAIPVFAIAFLLLRRWRPKPPKPRRGDQFRPLQPSPADKADGDA